MIYFPPQKKYVEVDVDMHDNRPSRHIKTTVKSDAWRLSIILSWAVFLYTYAASRLLISQHALIVSMRRVLITFVTFFLLVTTPTETPQPGTQSAVWATFLGVTSALLSAMQYAPQLVHTYRHKLVGALSIKMMLMQSPGAALMVTSIVLRYDMYRIPANFPF